VEQPLIEEQKEQEKGKTNWKKEVKSWVITIGAAVLAVVFLQTCVIVNANVPTGSMEDTIMAGDRIIAGRFSYWFSDPERGDIAVFRYPDDESKLYVKRVIGLPGETVEIKGGEVYIDGEVLEEPYLDVETIGDFGPYEVPEESYFMMGDNRNDSQDSRYWNNTFVKRNKILGKVYFTYLPKIKWLD
jgi:signal peptidase I